MEYVTLNNGHHLPLLGLGTYLIKNSQLQSVFKDAYNLGYKCFDSAWLYRNEKDLKHAIKQLGIDRKELFITSKIDWKQFCYVYPKLNIWSTKKRKSIQQCLTDSLKRLGTDYIDLYLIHWPNPYYYLEIWKVLISLLDQKQIRTIGVANFLQPHLETLYLSTGVYPSVNQIELHPLNTQKELILYCKEHNIALQAHTPLAQGCNDLLKNEILLNLSRKYNKSVSQIILRWIVQQKIAVCPKSIHYNRLKENINIFDFFITESDMSLIDSLNQNRYFHNDPHKTLI